MQQLPLLSFPFPALEAVDLGGCLVHVFSLLSGLCRSSPLRYMRLPNFMGGRLGRVLDAMCARPRGSPRVMHISNFLPPDVVAWQQWWSALQDTEDLTMVWWGSPFTHGLDQLENAAQDEVDRRAAPLWRALCHVPLRRLCLTEASFSFCDVAAVCLPHLVELTLVRPTFYIGAAGGLVFSLVQHSRLLAFLNWES